MWLGSFDSAEKTSSFALLNWAKTEPNGDLHVSVFMTRLTSCRVHTGCSLYGNPPCMHTLCLSLQYLLTLYNNIKYEYIYKANHERRFITSPGVKLTLLCLPFVLATCFTSSTSVVHWGVLILVVTILTATNSVLVDFTFRDLFSICCRHKEIRRTRCFKVNCEWVDGEGQSTWRCFTFALWAASAGLREVDGIHVLSSRARFALGGIIWCIAIRYHSIT